MPHTAPTATTTSEKKDISNTVTASSTDQSMAAVAVSEENPKVPFKPLRDSASIPLRKLSVGLIKTYKHINEVCLVVRNKQMDRERERDRERWLIL